MAMKLYFYERECIVPLLIKLYNTHFYRFNTHLKFLKIFMVKYLFNTIVFELLILNNNITNNSNNYCQ